MIMKSAGNELSLLSARYSSERQPSWEYRVGFMAGGISVSCIMAHVSNPDPKEARTRRTIVSSSVSEYSLPWSWTQGGNAHTHTRTHAHTHTNGRVRQCHDASPNTR